MRFILSVLPFLLLSETVYALRGNINLSCGSVFFLHVPKGADCHIRRIRRDLSTYTTKRRNRGSSASPSYSHQDKGSRKVVSAHNHNNASNALGANSCESETVTDVILLAGGVGKRLKVDRPKQFLAVNNRLVIEYSLEVFGALEFVRSLVVVVNPAYEALVQKCIKAIGLKTPVFFASPGKERSDSVFNGLLALKHRHCEAEQDSIVAVHDSARPCVTEQEVRNLLKDCQKYGAATLAVPAVSTIKNSHKVGDGAVVSSTLRRENLWEAHTPQAVKRKLFFAAYDYLNGSRGGKKPSLLDEKPKSSVSGVSKNSLVTDDTSVVELFGYPVKLTPGCCTNMKITTPEDLDVVGKFLKRVGR